MSRVLLLDNKQAHLNRLEQQLTRADIECSRADCVVSALESAHSGNLDLIVSLDKLDGFDVIDLLEIKDSQTELADLPVLVLSTSGKRKLDCFRLGCDDFIQLPVDEPELIFRVCAVLRRTMKTGLSGSFQHVTFADLIQMLMAARRGGRLDIEGDNFTGQVFLQEGQVVHASCGKTVGEEAFLQLMRGTQGSGAFMFAADFGEKFERTIAKRTDHLLLGLANRLDEEKM